jgi:Leucine-rich repeat (LRR) protein
MNFLQEAVMGPVRRGFFGTAVFALIVIYSCSVAISGNASEKEAQAKAVAVLTRLGVPLQHDPKGIVRWIEATKGELNNEAMSHLPGLPALEWLEIGGGSVTRAGLENLKDCTALRRLYVHDINLAGDPLAWLSNLKNLEALSLQRTRIDGSVLKNLKSPGLTVLNLSGDDITDDDMDQIAALAGLEVLALADTRITGTGIEKLEGMKGLNELNIMNCAVVDSDLDSFLSMPNLRIVYAAGCNLSDMAIQGVVYRFPMLAIFR